MPHLKVGYFFVINKTTGKNILLGNQKWHSGEIQTI
jgi:hypothetical protein